MKCPKCGNEIANDSLFCEYCGTRIHKANVSNAECKVHVKWLLYVSMLFTCALNCFVFEVPYYHLGGAVIWPLLVQIGIFIFASYLRYKKRIAILMLLLSLFMLIVNILFCIDALTFDGFPDSSREELCYYIYGHYYHDSDILLFISPLILLLCMMYEFYSYKKAR